MFVVLKFQVIILSLLNTVILQLDYFFPFLSSYKQKRGKESLSDFNILFRILISFNRNHIKKKNYAENFIIHQEEYFLYSKFYLFPTLILKICI